MAGRKRYARRATPANPKRETTSRVTITGRLTPRRRVHEVAVEASDWWRCACGAPFTSEAALAGHLADLEGVPLR